MNGQKSIKTYEDVLNLLKHIIEVKGNMSLSNTNKELLKEKIVNMQETDKEYFVKEIETITKFSKRKGTNCLGYYSIVLMSIILKDKVKDYSKEGRYVIYDMSNQLEVEDVQKEILDIYSDNLLKYIFRRDQETEYYMPETILLLEYKIKEYKKLGYKEEEIIKLLDNITEEDIKAYGKKLDKDLLNDLERMDDVVEHESRRF